MPPYGTAQEDIRAHRWAAQYKTGKGIFQGQMYGLYRGVVEYNRDPEQRGRIMVRILEDGPEMKIADPNVPRVSTFDLGWCDPCFTMWGGKGFGSFSVPPVGSRVFVMFIRGDRQTPVYFGGWVANSDKQKRYGATRTTLEPPKNQDGTEKYPAKPPPYWDYWMEDQGNESAIETNEMLDNQPDVHMFFKTLKGASLMAKERDHAEELVLTDRQGAELRFESKTNGLHRRGMRSASQYTPIGDTNLDISHKVKLIDAVRQGLEMEVSNVGDRFVILHQSDDIPKSPDSSGSRSALELNRGEHKVRLVCSASGVTLAEIEMDTLSSTFTVKGLNTLKLATATDMFIEAPSIRLNGEVTVDGDIRHVGGHKFIFVNNEQSIYGSQFRNMHIHDDVEQPFVFPRRDNTDIQRNQTQFSAIQVNQSFGIE